MEYVHSCFYSENAPKVHNVPYRTREIFMSLVIEADEFERGCKQAASPDAEECMLRFSFTLLLIAVTHPLFAQFTYAPINVPGATSTEARGINNNGEIVGFYVIAACVEQRQSMEVPTCPTHGFKLVNGRYIELMVPTSFRTAIMGVNDYGDLVGFYVTSELTCSSSVYHGFIWYHTNAVRKLDYPGTDVCPTSSSAAITVPFGINKAGIVVGGVWGIGPNSSFPDRGWVWRNGTFSTMNPTLPGNPAGACCWSVTGISNTGVLAGLLFQSDFWQAWMKAGTDQDFFTYPTVNQCCDTTATGVNSAVDMIGFDGGPSSFSAGNGWFTKHIELNEVNDTEVKPSFIKMAYPGQTNIQPPGPLPTFPFGINDARGVVGTYFDTNNQQHGFLAKPNF